jgi:hypothetical protein
MTQGIMIEPMTHEQVMRVINLTQLKYIGLARANVREEQV